MQLLAECTERLGLARAASKVYTRDGSNILTLHGLILWAVGETLSQRDPKEQESSPDSVGTEETAVQNAEGWLTSPGISQFRLCSILKKLNMIYPVTTARIAKFQPVTFVSGLQSISEILMVSLPFLISKQINNNNKFQFYN